MMPRFGWVFAAAIWCAAAPAHATEIVIYGFEQDQDGWTIPDWAKGSPDYVGKELAYSPDIAQEGVSSLKIWTDFPGQRWAGAYVEREIEVTDWTPFNRLTVSVYVPEGAPAGLQGRVILTVGEQWQWTEMNRTVALMPKTWTAMTVSLKPGSMDWKFFPDESFRKAVHKIGVRIESNQGPAYSGPVFVDNIRLSD